MKDIDQTDAMDYIQKSKLIVFFLTNEYVQSEEFKILYNYTKINYKPIIIFNLESINHKETKKFFDSNQLNMFDVYRNSWKDDQVFMYRLWYFILPLFNTEKVNTPSLTLNNYNEVQVIDKLIKMVEYKKKHHFQILNKFKIFDIQELNYFIIVTQNSEAFLFKRVEISFIKKIKFDYGGLEKVDNIIDMCFVKHLKKFCIIGKKKIFFMNEDFDKMEFHTEYYSTNLKFIVYHEKSENVYLFKENENETEIASFVELENGDIENNDSNEFNFEIHKPVEEMKIFNDLVFYLTEDSVFVYDLDINFIGSFGSSILYGASSLIVFNKFPNYIYVATKSSLLTFDLHSFKNVGRLDLDENLNKLFITGDDNLVSYSTNLNYFKIFKVIFKYSRVKIADPNLKYICQINPYNKHVLKNPYELPCGNISCLQCIYDNYNTFTNKFKCSFESFKVYHQLNHHLKKSSIIEDNTIDLCRNQIQYFSNSDEAGMSLNMTVLIIMYHY